MSTNVKQELKRDRRRDRRRKRILGIIILIIVLLLCAGLAFAGETTVVNQYDTNLTEDFVQKVYADGINKYSKDKMSFDEISKYVARLIGADLKGSNLFTDEQIKYIEQYVMDNSADIDKDEVRNQVVNEVSRLIDEKCMQNYITMVQIDSNLKELIQANSNLDDARYQELLQADKNLLLWLNTSSTDLGNKIYESTDALNKRIDELEKRQGNDGGDSEFDTAEVERLKERVTQLENQRNTVVSAPIDLTEINNKLASLESNKADKSALDSKADKSAVETMRANLQARINGLDEAKENHEARIAELEAKEIPDVTGLAQDLADLTASYNNLKNDVDAKSLALTNRIDELLGMINANKDAIAANTTNITNNTTNINKNAKDIADNKKELEDKLKTVDDANKQLQSDISTKIGEDKYNEDITNINNTTDSINESVKNLKGQIEGLGTAASQAEVDRLKGEIEALADQINNMNTTVNQYMTENKEKYNYRYEEVDGQPTLYIEEINY